MVAQTTSSIIAFRIPEAVKLTGLSRSKLYELLAQGEIRARKSGGITLIERAELERYVAGLPYADIAGAADRELAKAEGGNR